ncbi:hypothetical protein B0H14DRAFT_3449797 [Mycena olivaceomarginata]|nr:hypothetical protein B0H14DRAFT_3449797 [Mycena olivaceomarginata]
MSPFPLPSPASSYIGGTSASPLSLSLWRDHIPIPSRPLRISDMYIMLVYPRSSTRSSPFASVASPLFHQPLPCYTLPGDVFAWRSSPFLHHIPLRPFPGDTFDLHPNDTEPWLLVAKRVEFVWLPPLSPQTLPPALQATTARSADVACTPFLRRTCAAAGNLPPLVDRLPFIPPRQKLAGWTSLFPSSLPTTSPGESSRWEFCAGDIDTGCHRAFHLDST